MNTINRPGYKEALLSLLVSGTKDKFLVLLLNLSAVYDEETLQPVYDSVVEYQEFRNNIMEVRCFTKEERDKSWNMNFAIMQSLEELIIKGYE